MAAFPAALNDLHTAVGSSGTALATGHVSNHTAIAADVEGLAAKVGVTSSAVTTSHDYLIRTRQVTLNAQVDSYTLVLGDAGKLVIVTKGSGTNLTVDTNANVAFATGTRVLVAQGGAGLVTIVAAGGVTITTSTTLKLNGAGAVAELIKTGTDTWLATGDRALV